MPSLRLRSRALALSCIAALGALAAVLAGACAPLDVISENVCGNRVLDPGEDCDTQAAFTDPKNGYKGTCIAAGQTNECRFEVATCAVKDCAVCPTGYLAGLDGVCRRPSGLFLDPAVPVTITGTRPRVIDLDGDHEKDLMIDGQDAEEFAFIQGGIVRGLHSIPKNLHASPAVGELRGSPVTPDIVLPTGSSSLDGFALFRGTVSGPPEAHTFPVYDVGGPFRVVPVSARILGSDAPLDAFNAGLLLDCANGKSNPFCANGGIDGYRVVIPANDPPATWRRTPGLPLTNAFPHQGKPGRLLALPFRNGDDGCIDTIVAAEDQSVEEMRLLRPCAPAGPLEIVTDPIQSDLPSNCKLVTLMTSKKGNNEKVSAMFACGSANVFATMNYPAAGTPTFQSGCPSGLVCNVPDSKVDCGPTIGKTRRILAQGDFNGDGIDDYATTHGIFFGSGSDDPGFTVAGSEADQPGNFPCWRQAVGTDLNADGIVDIAAVPFGEAGIDVVLGSKHSVLASTVLGSEATVTDASLSDFDGDGTTDIAIALDSGSGEKCADQLASDVAILWGRPQGFPEDAETVGRVTALAQLASGVLYRDATGLASDGLADLAAISQSDLPDCTIASGAVFAGSATRSIVTPFNMLVRARGVLKDPDIKAVAIADVALADGPELGILLNTGGRAVVDIVTTDDSDAMVTNNCAPMSDKVSDCPNLVELPGVGTVTSAAMAAIGDKVAAAVAPERSNTVLVALYNGPGTQPTLLAPIQPGFQAARIDLVVGDLDNDGADDLAVIAFDRDKPDLTGALTFAQVFHSDELVDKALGCHLTDLDNDAIVGLASLHVGDATSPVIATKRKVRRYPAIDHACATGEAFEIPSSKEVALPLDEGDIRSIATGDLNGDGIDDIAIAAQERTLILRQGTTNQYAYDEAHEPAEE